MTTCSLRVMPVTDAEWSAWLDRAPHDTYQTAAYHRLEESQGLGQPFLAVYGTPQAFVAWPYLLRPVHSGQGEPRERTDVTSVYGYSGPVTVGCGPGDALFEAAWSELLAAWVHQGAVSAFTRFHPLLGNHDWIPARAEHLSRLSPGLVPCGDTVSIDLRVPEASTVADYNRKLRQEINAARRAGMTTRLDVDWVCLDEFISVYFETMTRNGAAPEYFFPRSYFDDLKAALGPHAHLFVSWLDGQVVAGCICLTCAGTMQAHLGGFRDAFRALSPYKLMFDDIRRMAVDRGDTVFHLGGGRGGRADSLFEFKARFSRRRHPFFTGRWVLDEDAYRALAERRARQAAHAGLADGAPGFFPIYRAPLTSSAPRDTGLSACAGVSSRGAA